MCGSDDDDEAAAAEEEENSKSNSPLNTKTYSKMFMDIILLTLYYHRPMRYCPYLAGGD